MGDDRTRPIVGEGGTVGGIVEDADLDRPCGRHLRDVMDQQRRRVRILQLPVDLLRDVAEGKWSIATKEARINHEAPDGCAVRTCRRDWCGIPPFETFFRLTSPAPGF